MKKNIKEKKQRIFPQRNLLTLLIFIFAPILLAILIAIPTIYITNYNENKVTPFANDIKDIEDVIYGDKNTELDFNFVLYCTSYNDETGAVTFRTFMYENENSSNVIINTNEQVYVKLGMCSDWIKTDEYSSNRGRRIAVTPKKALSSSLYYADQTLSGIPNMPAKGSLPFVNISSIPVYAYITYKTSVNGTITTKHYILKYEYKDYIISKINFDEGTENAVSVGPTTGGIVK